MIAYGRRRRKPFLNILPVVSWIVALILVVVLVVCLLVGQTDAVKARSLKHLAMQATDVFVPFEDGVVYRDSAQEHLYYVDGRGNTIWGYAGTVEGMKLYAGNGKVGVAAGKKLQIINKDGDFLFSKEFDRNVANVAIGKKLIAVSLSDSDDTVILNTTGERVDTIVSNSDATNIRYGTYGDGSVWVISVEDSGYHPKYQLSTYKYDTEKTQTVTFEEDSQMMYDALFDDNVCYLYGTQSIMVRDCDYSGSVSYDYTVNGFDVVHAGKIGKSIHILLLNNGDLKTVSDGKTRDITFDDAVLWAMVAGKQYYAFSAYYMYKINPSTGKYKRYRMPYRIDELTVGNGCAIIRSGDEMYIYAV